MSKRIVIAFLIAFGPVSLPLAYFIATFMPGDANGGAGFYLGIGILLTPGCIAAGVAYLLFSKKR